MNANNEIPEAKPAMTCPICGRTVGPEDRMILKWNNAGWWVTYHYIRMDEYIKRSGCTNTTPDYTDHTGAYHSWCTQSGIQSAVPAEAALGQ